MTLTRNFSTDSWGGKPFFGGKQKETPSNEILIYGIALGLLAGAAVSTYVWRSRVREALEASPDERADKIIESCERKLERIEKLMQEFGEKK